MKNDDDLQTGILSIAKLFQAVYAIDLNLYDQDLVLRRISRLKTLRGFETIQEYCSYLEQNESEQEVLYRNLFCETSFDFKNGGSVEDLKSHISSSVQSAISSGDDIRVWVPGCGTGQGAYLITILFNEYGREKLSLNRLSVYATDIHGPSIRTAQKGAYSKRFFDADCLKKYGKYFYSKDDDYHVIPEIRRMIVFARHDMLTQPPFLDMDYICCQNVMKYFNPDARKKMAALFHFALKSGGVLYLPKSDQVMNIFEFFEKAKPSETIFIKRSESKKPAAEVSFYPQFLKSWMDLTPEGKIPGIYQSLMDRFIPPGILVDEARRVVHTFGNARDVLKVPWGVNENDIFKMVDGNLKTAISIVFYRALYANEKSACKNIPVHISGKELFVHLSAEIFSDPQKRSRFVLIQFDVPESGKMSAAAGDLPSVSAEPQYEKQFEKIRDILETSIEQSDVQIEELKASTEKLTVSNQKLLSINQELRMTNEDLRLEIDGYREGGENEKIVGDPFVSEAQNKFFLHLGHDIRTPLNAIIGFSRLLKNAALSPRHKDYVSNINISAESLLCVIENILNYPFLQSRTFSLDMNDFNMEEAVFAVIDIFAQRLSDQSCEIACWIDGGIPAELYGDVLRIKQILFNLLEMVIRPPAKKEITVRIDGRKGGASTHRIRFEIHCVDQDAPASPIHPSDMQTVHEKNGFQSQKDTHVAFWVTEKLIELMGGTLHFTSNTDHTSLVRFSVFFHCNEIPQTRFSPSFRDKTILIADTHPNNLAVMKAYLEDLECGVVGVSDAREAMALLEKGYREDVLFDAAIIELDMYIGNELDLTRLLHRYGATIPIVIVPPGRENDYVQKMSGEPAFWIQKPVSRSRLIEAMSAAFEMAETFPSPINGDLESEKRSKLNILIVEDQLTNQKVAEGIITKFGFTCDIASDGKEGLQAFTEKAYDLILMDIQMPVMDGLEAARNIRNATSSASSRDLPIIAMTARDTPDSRNDCREAGMTDYISKPIDGSKLFDIIKKHIPAVEVDAIPVSYGPKPEKESAVFDREELLSRVGGDEALCLELLELFLEDMPEQIQKLHHAIENNDTALAKFQAHSIKGMAANISAYRLKDIAARIDHAEKNEDFGKARILMKQLETEFLNFKSVITRDIE